MKINLKSIKMHKNTKGMMNSVTCKQNHHNCLPKKYKNPEQLYITQYSNIPNMDWRQCSAHQYVHMYMYIYTCMYKNIYIYI